MAQSRVGWTLGPPTQPKPALLVKHTRCVCVVTTGGPVFPPGEKSKFLAEFLTPRVLQDSYFGTFTWLGPSRGGHGARALLPPLSCALSVGAGELQLNRVSVTF